MHRMIRGALLVMLLFGLTTIADAQAPPPAPERPWSLDFGIGWDKGISGNINSGAIGTLEGQTTVLLPNKYEDVYGTGLHIHIGAGYLLEPESELRLSVEFQSLDADLVLMGDFGISRLYAQYDDYRSTSLDFGYRRYVPIQDKISGYAEGYLGIAIINELDVTLAAPGANFTGPIGDFYDQTAAFSFGANAGVMYQAQDQTDVYAQVGIRRVTGMTDVDNLNGTGLDDINNHSARWAVPFTFGVRVRF